MSDHELRRTIRSTLMPGFAGPVLPDWLAAELAAGLGSVCLFGTNVVDPGQLQRLTTAIHESSPGALVAIDEEGGDVTRLHHLTGSPHPSAAYLGSLDDEAFTAAVAASIGSELRAAGVDLNLAPDADVNSNPRNPVIGVRSFGAEPGLVARHVAAYTRGLQGAGVGAVAKHFPGHGDTSADSHRELPAIDAGPDVLAARELVPFRAAVTSGTLGVMTSHILVRSIDPTAPATMSAPVLRVLREDLGFSGAIISDALDMAGASGGRGIAEAAVLALAAGVDLLCIGTDNSADQLAGIVEHVLVAVKEGRLTEGRLLDAAASVHALSAGVAALRGAAARTAEGPAVSLTKAPPDLTSKGFWLRGPIAPVTAPVLLRLESQDNIAAGDTVWGIGAHLARELDRWLPGATCATAGDLDGVAAVLAAHPGRPLVVQGRDLARVEFLARAVAIIRQARPDAVLVELGWPELPGVPPVDIATYGSSRGAAICLTKLLAKGAR